MIGPFRRQGPAVSLRQHCPLLTDRRCIVIVQPDFHGVLEDVPGAGGGDVVGDGGVVPHDEEAELLLVHPLILVVAASVAVWRMLGLQMDMRYTPAAL